MLKDLVKEAKTPFSFKKEKKSMVAHMGNTITWWYLHHHICKEHEEKEDEEEGRKERSMWRKGGREEGGEEGKTNAQWKALGNSVEIRIHLPYTPSLCTAISIHILGVQKASVKWIHQGFDYKLPPPTKEIF